MPPAAALPESDILKPKDPSIDDDNEWPEFSLTNVSVHSAFATSVSLLEASDSSPLTITGRLERLSQEQTQFLLHRDSLPATVTITNVTRYAYGQYDDGEVAFWAAGEAGWFKIRAGRLYKPVYHEMLSAVGALYFAADMYRGIKGNKTRMIKTVAAREIFANYAKQAASRCETTDEAERLYIQHATFLVDRMKKGAEEVKWKQTTLLPFLEAAMTRESPAPETPSESPSDPEVDYTKRLAGKGKSVLRPRSSLQPAKGPTLKESSPTPEGQTRSSKPPVSNARLMQLHAAREKRAENLQRRRSEALNGGTVARKQAAAQDEDVQMTSPSNDDQMSIGSLELEQEKTVDDDTIILMPRSHRESLPTTLDRQLPSDSPLPDINTSPYDAVTGNGPQPSQSQTQIDLIHREERPYLPISNLLKRVKVLAAVKTEGRSLSEDGVHDISQVVAGSQEW